MIAVEIRNNYAIKIMILDLGQIRLTGDICSGCRAFWRQPLLFIPLICGFCRVVNATFRICRFG